MLLHGAQPERSLTAQDLGVDLTEPEAQAAQRQRPGDYLEFSPRLTVAVVGLASGGCISPSAAATRSSPCRS